jgi:hypothetical protein
MGIFNVTTLVNIRKRNLRGPITCPGYRCSIQPVALPLKGVTALFTVNGADKSPGMIKI